MQWVSSTVTVNVLKTLLYVGSLSLSYSNLSQGSIGFWTSMREALEAERCRAQSTSSTTFLLGARAHKKMQAQMGEMPVVSVVRFCGWRYWFRRPC